MSKNGRFLFGLGGVALVVTWLVWTGISSTMVYYLTPTELLANVVQDPGLHEAGVKVSGRVVSESYSAGEDEVGPYHRFSVEDLENAEQSFPVVYRDPLPDTFHEGGEVVVEGRYASDGLFTAATVLTKCGSRYEAMPEGASAVEPGQTIPNVSGASGDGAGSAGYEASAGGAQGG
jgi:cytochrome c-type biogenesis protein CcmE